jgi:alcohol dehydrogenase (cytochrome c)
MFVATPGNQVLAIDAKKGDLLWRFKRPMPEDILLLHPTSRGVGLLGDKVYFAAADAVLVALDAKTGKELWNAKVEDYTHGYYMSLAPLVADGKVMVGCSGGELGVRGFVAAFDAETGNPLWKTYSVPAPGEPGSETWPQGDQWKTGGGSVWITGAYDPATNLAFWGTGNGGPWMGDQRPGDNFFTSSTIALDASTGQIKGFHQYHPNDSWDWDEVNPPVLVDYQHNGKTVKGLVYVARDGYLWMLERTADKINFVDGKPFVKQNVFLRLDPETGRPDVDPARQPGTGKKAEFCPSLWGGKDWPPPAYSPKAHLLYIPANENLCQALSGDPVTYTPGQRFTGIAPANSIFSIAPGADHIGELQAWNLDTGQKVWSHPFANSPLWGPVLATAGGVLFMGGTNDRYFRAFDASNGKILWEFRTGSGVNGVPVSFQLDGKQYIAVQSGWGVDAARMQARLNVARPWEFPDVPQGGAVWVFALD